MTWGSIKLGAVLKRVKNLVEIEKDKEYKLVTVKLHHKGVTLRKTVKGDELSSNKMHAVKTGEFILSGIDARHGAFGIVPKELEGAVVSNDFWCLEFDEDVIDKHLFLKLTSTSFFDDLCKKASDGTTNRVRLQAEKFFNLEINLPPVEIQKGLIESFQQLENNNTLIIDELSNQLKLVSQLRQSFLREAMKGQLVQQDVKDEPAGVLLERIKVEKENLIAAKKIKAGKTLPSIKAEEIPFEIPSNWTWCRLGDLADMCLGKMLDQVKNQGSLEPYLRNVNVRWGSFDLSDLKHMRFIKDEEDRYSVVEGDLVICEGGEPGRAAIWKNQEPIKIQKALHRVRTNSQALSSDYVYYCLLGDANSKRLNEYFTGGGIQHLTGRSLSKYAIPLPPLAEQNRIVEKLEMLMEYCDHLEASIRESKTQAETLLQVALKEALEPKELAASSL